MPPSPFRPSRPSPCRLSPPPFRPPSCSRTARRSPSFPPSCARKPCWASNLKRKRAPLGRSFRIGSRYCAALPDDDLRVHRHPVVQVDHVDVAHADAARRDGKADLLRLVGAVDAVESVLVALVEIERASPERIARAALGVLDM